MDRRSHWNRIYAERDPQALSWQQSVPTTSLKLIAEANLDQAAAIVDVGGGTSTLAAHLLDAGYTDITVTDISAAAVQRAQTQLGSASDRVAWIEADIRSHDFGREFDLWHDRAVMHFMVDEADRDAYLDAKRRALRPGGHLILATFGPDGPTRCSGLPVHRYQPDELSAIIGSDFETISTTLELHHTPSGSTQQFLYLHARHQPAG